MTERLRSQEAKEAEKILRGTGGRGESEPDRGAFENGTAPNGFQPRDASRIADGFGGLLPVNQDREVIGSVVGELDEFRSLKRAQAAKKQADNGDEDEPGTHCKID
jgi:hypothetical protein